MIEKTSVDIMPCKEGKPTHRAFGASHLPENGCEWCEDDWHDEGAPSDGRAWIDPEKDPTYDLRVVKGDNKYIFREMDFSSYRTGCSPFNRDEFIGFRAVLLVPGTP